MLQSLSSAKAAILGLAAASVAAGVLTGGAQSAPLKELSSRALARIDGDVKVQGLQSDVRIVRDTWGVPHIYAKSDGDLFFAQGYVAAQDRLWQMEMWRRTAEGRLAEVLGPQAVGRDRMARLLKYRGRFDRGRFDCGRFDCGRSDRRRLHRGRFNHRLSRFSGWRFGRRLDGQRGELGERIGE